MINDLDLKVLKAIHILCQSGSVSKTAEILEVTPGAVSYLINKARKATGTSLFSAHVMVWSPMLSLKSLVSAT